MVHSRLLVIWFPQPREGLALKLSRCTSRKTVIPAGSVAGGRLSHRRRRIMGAIAVSKKEEQQIERLRRELHMPLKSRLIRAAQRSRNPCAGVRQPIRRNIGNC